MGRPTLRDWSRLWKRKCKTQTFRPSIILHSWTKECIKSSKPVLSMIKLHRSQIIPTRLTAHITPQSLGHFLIKRLEFSNQLFHCWTKQDLHQKITLIKKSKPIPPEEAHRSQFRNSRHNLFVQVLLLKFDAQ